MKRERENERELGALQKAGYTCAICRQVVDGSQPGYVRICNICTMRGRKAPARAAAREWEPEQYPLNL